MLEICHNQSKDFLGICLEFCIDDEEMMLPTVICCASDKG